jgi:hypothetical protein
MPWLRRASFVSHLWGRWLKNRLQKDPQLEFQEITRADNSLDRLWNRCRRDAMFSTVRDSAWVQWRFLSSPTREYRVVLARRGGEAVGYSASHVAKNADKTSAFLAEVVAPDSEPAVRDSLLAEAIESAYAAGADILAALAIPGTVLHKLLRRAGFLPGPAFAVHIVPFAADLPMEQMRNPQNWRLSGAEFDVL